MNKKKLLNILYILVIAASLFCTISTLSKLSNNNNGRRAYVPKEERRSDPKTTLEFITSTKYNFKEVKGDTVLSNRYVLKNTGENPLIIYSVDPNCICSGFYLSKKVILPQDTASIDITLNTKNKDGFQNVTTVVSANTNKGMYKLTFMGIVKR